jgi:putative membrane protein
MSILIVALLIIAVVAIFSAQNALPVSIVFLFWKFQASLAIVIFLSALTGVVIASIIFLWLRIRRTRKTVRILRTGDKPT